MKRLCAMLLTLVMLFALLPAGMQAEAEQATEKPFYMVNWDGYETQYPNVYDLPYFWAYPMQPGETEGMIAWNNETDIPTIAKNLKKKFDAQPEGTRYINYCLAAESVWSQAEHVIYHDKAVRTMEKWLDAFLAEYKRIGGLLDGVVIDVEYIDSHPYYLQDYYKGSNGKTVNKNIYADIVKDPRYATEVRPLLVELGFEFYPNPSGQKSEIWTMYPGDASSYRKKSYDVWVHVMDYMERVAYRRGVLEPLLRYYPDATMSDYQSGAHVTWEKSRDVSGGALPYNLISAGNLANANVYAGRSASVLTEFPGKNKVINETTPFAATQNDVNLFREILASTPDGRICAWLGNYEYGVKDEGNGIVYPSNTATYSGSPYYSEVIYHIGMLNPEVFLGFLIRNKIIRDGFDVDESIKVTSDILVELSRVAGYSDRKAIPQKSNWNGDYILSGMYAGGRNIWRITPDTTKVSVEDFKIKDKAPTFRVGNLTITFPNGRIIEDGAVSRAGTCGYWVETPMNVQPVVTADTDRYVKDPSLWVTFEEYTTGATFSKNVGLPADCWQVSGSPKIESGANGNALAMNNGNTVSCKTLPKYITAGDAYAKQQGWEVSVTLPSGYNGTAQLLKAGTNDGGFQISGSKLYYDESGSYKEFPGVDLSAGTYILRRQLDMRNNSAFTCNYAVFASDGSFLGEVNNVPLRTFALPVAEIIMQTSGSGKVLVDDLNLYPMGTSTVLELYETTYGRQVAANGARTEETAYRMSWLNATNDYKVAYVYDTATRAVIRKVEMAPGMDGVVTGVYDPAGKAVTFAVEVQIVDAPEQPDYDAGFFDWAPYEEVKAPGGDGQSNGGSTNGGDSFGGNDATTSPDGDGDGAPDMTVPAGTVETVPGQTGPSATPDGTSQDSGKKLDPGLIVLIVCLSVAVLGGGGFALYWFVLKPKLAGKAKEDVWTSDTQVISGLEEISLDDADADVTEIVDEEVFAEEAEALEAEEAFDQE